jgi:hypothetical protein
MSLSKSPTFKATGLVLGGLAILSFSLRVFFKVAYGHGNDTYVSGKGVVWTYSSALVLLVIIGVVLVFGGGHQLWELYTERKWRSGR